MSQDNPYNNIVGAALAAQKAEAERASADAVNTVARNARLAADADHLVRLVIAEAHKARDALAATPYRLSVTEHKAIVPNLLSGVELQLSKGGNPFHDVFFFSPGSTMKLFRMRPEGVGKGPNQAQDLTRLFGLSEGSQFYETHAQELVTRIVNQINPDIPSITDQLHDYNAQPFTFDRGKLIPR